MGKKGMYVSALAVCVLGMMACAGGKKDGMTAPELQEQVTADGQEGKIQDDGQQDRIQTGAEEENQGGQRQDALTEGVKPEEPAGAPEENRGENPAEGRTEKPEESRDEDIPDLDGNMYVSGDEVTEEYKSADGTVLLTVDENLPVVVISDREQAAGKINEYIREKSVFGRESMLSDMSAEEVLEMAEMDYEERGKDNWVAEYSLSVSYGLCRMDDRVVSFKMLAYYYLGGAHGNTSETGLTFDTQTGERLMLADVVEDEEAASSAVMEFLLEETGKEEYRGVLFADYENYLGDLLSETTWYLGEDGFHIIANTYSIAPYVAGSFDFVIPYGRADFLKDEYRQQVLE